MKNLTAREKKILDMIAFGHTSSTMAKALRISPHTVENHRRSLLVKFDARNSADLIRKAIQKRFLMVKTGNK